MDESWSNWTRLNLERGCAPVGIKQILTENGFAQSEIEAVMGKDYPGEGPNIDYKRLAAVRITKLKSGARKFRSGKIQLYTLDQFLNGAECDEITRITNENLLPSTVTVQSADNQFRTSFTWHLSDSRYPIVRAVDKKIADTIGISIAYSEGIQAQKYLPGQQFKPHTDFFEPGTDEYKVHCEHSGNRTWTFMVYLTDVTEGGGTAFREIEKTFFPKKGMAVIWNNLNADGTPNSFTLHSGEPVVRGEKVIITKWFRERGAGPMFLKIPET